MNTWNALLLTALVKGVAFGLGWLLLGHLRPRASAMWLTAWWRAGMVGIPLVTACLLLPNLWFISFGSPEPAAFTPATVIRAEAKSDDRIATPLAAIEIPVPKVAPIDPRALLMEYGLAAVWAMGAIAMVARLGMSFLRVIRIRRMATPMVSHEWNAELEEECRRLKPGRQVMLLSSAEVSAPFATGWRRPAIILPLAAKGWVETKRRSVLRHELCHILRRDIAFVWLAEIVGAIHWINPMVWLLRTRLLLAQERAADDAVLTAGVEAVDYAAVLAEVAHEGRRHAVPAGMAPMARKSTLGRRVGYVLDRTQLRGGGQAGWGFAAACLAMLVSGGVGLTGLRAQERSGSAAPRQAIAPEPTWSRTYRDTYRLQTSFAEHFPGTSETALAAFRRELFLAKVNVPETLEIELRPDKSTLVLQYDQAYQPSKHQSLIDYLVRAGWWDRTDSLKARIQATEQELAPMLKMLEDSRARTQDAAVKMAQIRERDRIIDADPDNTNAVISTSDRNVVAFESQLNEQRLKMTKIESSFERLQTLKPEEIGEGLRMLNIEDASINKMLEKQQDAAVEEAILAAEEGPDHPKIKGVRARKEAIEKLLGKALGRVVSSQESLMEMEKRTLAALEVRFKEAQSRQIEDKKRTNDYLEAKTRYLQAKRVAENIELKYNNEILDRSAGR